MKSITNLNNGDYIAINLFGKEKNVEVFSTGDNQYDENGDPKADGFALSEEEIDCLNWFIENVKIEDYREAITEYCNEVYEIAFYGGCECDPEHGICIGFRDKKFLGIDAQDWIL